MKFRGRAKRLDDIDLPRVGAMIGVGEDEIHAVLEVETRGGGFDRIGRPKMLFEPHVFYRNLSGVQRSTAVKRGLAYQKWKPGAYPTDSYPRLIEAMTINGEAALRSASWGLGQILGENYAAAGYGSAKEMVEDFLDDEERHLIAMVNFIKANRLDDDLRRHDWAGFARGYNGPGYARHGYHTRLQRAFEKWQRIPDTPFRVDRTPVDRNEVEPDPVRNLRIGHRGWDVRELQSDLIRLGHELNADGMFGPQTAAHVKTFQMMNGLEADAVVGPKTRAEIKSEIDALNVAAVQEAASGFGAWLRRLFGWS